MPSLEKILKPKEIIRQIGVFKYPVQLAIHSKNVKRGALFIAVKGCFSDGHLFIEDAIKNGATSIICEQLPAQKYSDVCYILVADSSAILARVADRYYDSPSKSIKIIGVTGTNGKTTVASLLYQLFNEMGVASGLISTVCIRIGSEKITSTHTTPDIITTQKYLAKMKDAGLVYCFMEVSSHGIHQGRIAGLHFSGGIFTNLSQDHLDYHKNFADYRDVKKSFFDGLPATAFALTNVDDKNGAVMLQNTIAKKYNYTLENMGDFKAKITAQDFHGMEMNIQGKDVLFQILGRFNAYNLLAVYATTRILLGLDTAQILRQMSTLKSVDGRLQYFISKGGIVALVDFAHTPDALENLLKAVCEVRHQTAKIYLVVGCGGDRDAGKRPLMGRIATRYANLTIFTADNPRGESATDIIAQMEAGVLKEDEDRFLTISNRLQALKTACKMAKRGDIVIAAGKGHENFQIIGKEKHLFNDREHLERILKI